MKQVAYYFVIIFLFFLAQGYATSDEKLITMLSNKNPVVRATAVMQLGKMKDKANFALPLLIKTLQDKNSMVLRATVYALGDIGIEALPTLIKALKHKNSLVRESSAYMISLHFGPKAQAAIPALGDLLHDHNIRVPGRKQWQITTKQFLLVLNLQNRIAIEP